MKLFIFDLDGTLVNDMEFYKKAYSENLNKLVHKRAGDKGLKILNLVRQSNKNRGELALLVFDIPFSDWFDAVSDDDLSLIVPKPELVKSIENIDGIKVVFTGSSKALAEKILVRVGFDLNTFAEIIAFEKPAAIPVKLATDTIVFKYLLDEYNILPKDTFAIGDDYETDLLPAEMLGIHAIEVRRKSGMAKHFIANILDLPQYLKENFENT